MSVADAGIRVEGGLRRWLRPALTAAAVLVLLGAGVFSRFEDVTAGVRPTYLARDPVLRRAPLRFYRAAQPHALVWFFGNDVGFWGAQQRLAKSLADAGLDVVGMDLRAWFAARPAEPPERRAAAFRAAMSDLLARASRELGDTLLPLVLAGHSSGAEEAVWLAAQEPPPRLAGVVAISPGSRGHLKMTASDLAFGEPTERGSFAVDSMLRAIPAGVRVSLVRGASDRLRSADSVLVPSRPGLHRVLVPLAGHSMRRLFIAGPMIVDAMDWTIGR